MFASAYRRGAPALALVLGLAGCAGQQIPGAAIPQAPGASPQLSARSVKPDKLSRGILYVSDTFSKVVDEYAYPSLQYTGQLTGFAFPEGECTDKAGDVWIADAGGAVYEYAHGGTSPIEKLTTDIYQPAGCAIEPKTGDLAVANGNIEVLVFPGGTGTPIAYRDFNFKTTTSLGYDNRGNLFVDGLDYYNNFHYAELRKHAETLADVTLNGFPAGNGAGGVQWDGSYVTVGDSEQTIYRTQGSNIVNTITLSTLCPFAFYIVPSKGTVIAPDQCGSNLVGVYPYPGGGSPSKAITSGLDTPYGAVLSM